MNKKLFKEFNSILKENGFKLREQSVGAGDFYEPYYWYEKDNIEIYFDTFPNIAIYDNKLKKNVFEGKINSKEHLITIFKSLNIIN